MEVKEIMIEDVVVIQDTDQIAYARNLMLKHGFSRLVVIDSKGIPVGIVTEKDIARKLRGNGAAWRKRPIDKISIRRVMHNDLITVKPDTLVKYAVDSMLKNDISSLPVIDGEELVGIITKSDLMKFYMDKFQSKWKVSELMSSEVITVNENHAITHVINIMEDNNIGRIVVMRDSEPIGIITSENISFADIEDPETGVSVEKVYFVRQTEGKDKKNVKMVSMLTAGDIMTNDLLKISKDDDASLAAKMMIENDVSGIPVVENDELAGIITKTDIIEGIQ
ncbi:MAG: CBS domain-containing protein [Methanomicrobiales archaeon]